MTRANNVSSQVFSARWIRAGVVAVVGGVLLSISLSGCGWLFGKQKKPMIVNVELTAGDSLNFDGVRPQVVQVKLYILKDPARFMSGDTRAFFNEQWSPEWREQIFHKQDTMATNSATIGPNEVATARLEVPYAYARDGDQYFAAIADFLHPPMAKTERLSFKLQKRTKQTIKLTVGKDWIIRPD